MQVIFILTSFVGEMWIYMALRYTQVDIMCIIIPAFHPTSLQRWSDYIISDLNLFRYPVWELCRIIILTIFVLHTQLHHSPLSTQRVVKWWWNELIELVEGKKSCAFFWGRACSNIFFFVFFLLLLCAR